MTWYIILSMWSSSVLDELVHPHRTQTITANGKMSETSSVTSCVPQGSIVIPILFLLNMADMAHIGKMHRINDSEQYSSKVNKTAWTLSRFISLLTP